jgi:hypothetical protein
VEARINKCEDVFGRSEFKYTIAELNGDHPRYVEENIQRFKELGFVK